MRAFSRLTLEERKIIEETIKEGWPVAKIASLLKRGCPAIHGELRFWKDRRKEYNAMVAHEHALRRRQRKHTKRFEFIADPDPSISLLRRVECLEMQVEILTDLIKELKNGK